MPKLAKTAVEAVASIDDGEYIWCHSMAATPVALLQGLAEHAMHRTQLTLMQLHTEGSEVVADTRLRGHLVNRCYFVGATMREAVTNGMADYVPIFLSEIPKMFRRGRQRVDTALIQVSPPDKHGVCSLGVSVEATKAAVDVAGKVIAQINPRMPRTHGDGFIEYEKLHTVFECEMPLPEHGAGELDEITRRIGMNVASLIRDGDCLQTGIGAIPDAVLSCLTHHKDLGVHTEMFSDGLLPLIERGVVNGCRKKRHPGKIVAGFVLGTQRLYDFVDDNPEVVLLDIEYVNDTHTIRKNPNMVAINSALEVDLSGQVCADSIGTRIYSGVGGQMDFMRGAALSEGGRAIIALPATAKHGTLSRISPMLRPGAGVVTTRAHVQYVVTEYGVAELDGKSLKERAEALIGIAAPQFRESLAKAAREQWGLHVSV